MKYDSLLTEVFGVHYFDRDTALKIIAYIERNPGWVHLVKEEGKKITAEVFCEAFEETFGYGIERIIRIDRSVEIAEARQIAMAVMRKQSGWTTIEIGRMFHRDHATIIMASKRAEVYRKLYKNYGLQYDRLERNFQKLLCKN